jgi:uncharacterized protein YjiS (DUF1127 family)
MAFADLSPTDRPSQFSLADGIRAVVGWFAARRAMRAKKAALQSLLSAPEYRLRDLGISRDQLLKAIESYRK